MVAFSCDVSELDGGVSDPYIRYRLAREGGVQRGRNEHERVNCGEVRGGCAGGVVRADAQLGGVGIGVIGDRASGTSHGRSEEVMGCRELNIGRRVDMYGGDFQGCRGLVERTT